MLPKPIHDLPRMQQQHIAHEPMHFQGNLIIPFQVDQDHPFVGKAMHPLNFQALNLWKNRTNILFCLVELIERPNKGQRRTAGNPQPNILVRRAEADHQLILLLRECLRKNAALDRLIELRCNFPEQKIVNVHLALCRC